MRMILTLVASVFLYMLLQVFVGDSYWLVAVLGIGVLLPFFALGQRAKLKDEKGNQISRDRRLQREVDREIASTSADRAMTSDQSAGNVEREVAKTSRAAK